MRVLLFGADGQVGTEFRRRAGARGHEVVALLRRDCDLEIVGAAAAAIARVRPDGVVNAAAYTGVDKAESEPARAQRINAGAAGEIAGAAANVGAPLIHFSTDYVFDGEGCRPYLEEDATAPLGVYGASKLAGERAVAGAGGAHAILRLSWVFSAHGTNFVKTMLRVAREKGAARVVDDQRGRPTAAADAADAALIALEGVKSEPNKSGVYHFAGDIALTWADFAEEIFRAARLPVSLARITTSAYPTPARRPKYSVLDTTKIMKSFGIAAPSWRKSLGEAIAEIESYGTEAVAR